MLLFAALLFSARESFSALNATSFFPASGATNICLDTPLQITFDAPPKVNSAGFIRIYTAAGALADSIDLSQPSQTRLIGGVTFTNFAVITNGNTAAIFPHPSTLATNQSYYVTVDATVFSNAGSGAFAGVTGPGGWTFSTKPALPPAGTNYLVVAANNSGDFATVQGAVEFLPDGNTNHTLVFIRKGLYQEIVYVTNKNNITFRGEDRVQTVIAAANNSAQNTTVSPTNLVRQLFGVDANDIALENLSLTNTTPHGGGQAEALRIDGQRCVVYRVNFHSYQDTLKVSGSVYFRDCYIEGDTDFIWGFGTSYFTNCELKSLNTSGHNTQSRSDTNHYGYVFVNCSATKIAGLSSSSCDLGRFISASHPLSDYGHVAYVNCKMDTHIKAAGWGTTASTVRYWEYQSVMMDGVTAVNTSSRVSPSRQISSTEAAWMRDPTIVFGLVSNNVPLGGGWSPQLAPNILTAPANQIVASNQPAVFAVSATGVPDPAYQWLKDGTNIPGATSPALTVANAQPGDTGIYSVIVSNAAAAVTNSASLIVNPLPRPVLNSVMFNSGQFSLGIGGASGIVYTFLASSNLAQWTPVYAVTSAVTGFNWTDTQAGIFPARFYRVQVAVP